MNLDVDYLINFFKKNTSSHSKTEMGEQEDSTPSSPTGGSSSTGGSVPKWEDSYPIKRGKANPLMKAGEKWTTGLTRGSANQIW